MGAVLTSCTSGRVKSNRPAHLRWKDGPRKKTGGTMPVRRPGVVPEVDSCQLSAETKAAPDILPLGAAQRTRGSRMSSRYGTEGPACIAAENDSTVAIRHSDHSLTLVKELPAGSQSTVDLVKDVGERCAPNDVVERREGPFHDSATERKESYQRLRTQRGITSAPDVNQVECRRQNVRFHISPLAFTPTCPATRLGHAVSDTIRIPRHHRSYDKIAKNSFLDCNRRPATGDFTNFRPLHPSVVPLQSNNNNDATSAASTPQSSDPCTATNSQVLERSVPQGLEPQGANQQRHESVHRDLTPATHKDRSQGVTKRPRKPPRNYSYKASSHPKRISRTTEEFIAMWDAIRRSVSEQDLLASVEEGQQNADVVADDEMYMSHYATRMRGWQILTLAQDVIVNRVDAQKALDYLLKERLLDESKYRFLLQSSHTNKERNDAAIDLMLERGDTYFDAFRNFLRADNDQLTVSHLLDALNDIFVIGSNANGRNFCLTTKQCTVLFKGNDQKRFAAGTPRGEEPTIALDIYHENFGDARCSSIAGVLARHNIISAMSLVKNGITHVGVSNLLPGLVAAFTLRQLNLRLNPIRNSGLDVLRAALVEGGSSIVDLILSHTGLTVGCGAIVSRTLSSNAVLQSLDLSHNDLKDEDCAEISDGLSTNRTLRKLNLRDNSIGPPGCERLSDVLASGCCSLTSLDFSQNRILDDGARALSRVISSPKGSLRELQVENCRVTFDGCSALAKSLANDGSLQKLFLSNNNIADEGLRMLSDALASGNSLRTLHIDLCGGTVTGLTGLMRTLETQNRSLEVLSACYASTSSPGESRLHSQSAADLIGSDVSRARDALPGRKIVV